MKHQGTVIIRGIAYDLYERDDARYVAYECSNPSEAVDLGGPCDSIDCLTTMLVQVTDRI